MPILFEGIEIGRIDPIRLTAKGRVVTALINPEQAFRITGNSRLVWESVSLGAGGIKHADRLLAGPAIRLDYVAGERVKAMTLSSKEQPGGIKLVLQADDLAGLNEGAPLCLRAARVPSQRHRSERSRSLSRDHQAVLAWLICRARMPRFTADSLLPASAAMA